MSKSKPTGPGFQTNGVPRFACQTPSAGSPPTSASRWLPGANGKGKLVGLCFLLSVLVSLAFFPALHNDFIGYDDTVYVTDNVQVQKGLSLESINWAFRSIEASNWHPLTWLSHMADYQAYGPKPWGHHLTSELFHLANTLLIFLVFRRTTAATWCSFMVAALFGLHPLRVESVAWVAERKDVLSPFFDLLSLGAYVRYARHKLSPVSANPRGSQLLSLDYALAIVLFALALMSKSMLVTLPFVLLLLDYWPLQRFQPSTANPQLSTPRQPSTFDFRLIWRLVREKIPFFVLAAAASVVTFLVQSHTGAMVTGLPVLVRLENALVSYCRYLGKLCWPVDLSVFYPHPGGWPLQTVLLSGVILVGVSSLAFARRRQCPYLLLGWLWFLGALVPVIGLVQVGVQSLADRYTYFPMIGILVLLVWGAWDLTRCSRYQPLILSAAGTATIACCLALTRAQILHWKDGETLFRHATAVTASNCIAHNNLAVALEQKGLWDEAITHYREAIRLKPGYAEARNGLGLVLEKTGRSDEAISQLQEALRLQPALAEAHNGLGAALAKQGHLDEAVRYLQEALRLRPGLAEAHFNLGVVLGTQGRLDEAIQQYQETLKLKPDDAEAHNFLGGALANKGRFDEAIRHFQNALRLRPGYAEARENLTRARQMKQAPAGPELSSPKP